jgi:iron-sulfur cluster assembly protein
MKDNSAVQLTNSAASYINKMLSNTENAAGILLGVRKTGCSGLSYVVDFANAEMMEDKKYKKYESEGVIVLVESHNHEFLKGTIIDCLSDNISEYLKFFNPNAQGECGCGESFTV